MNVKELILSHPAVDIATALIDRQDIEPVKSSVTLSAKKNQKKPRLPYTDYAFLQAAY